MIKRKKKESNNLLFFIPYKNPAFKTRIDDKGNTVLTVTHKGFLNKIAQVLYFAPKKSDLHMDALGSFVWSQIDNKNNIETIASNVKEEFGDKAEPIYDRLVPYLRTLQKNGFIGIRNP